MFPASDVFMAVCKQRPDRAGELRKTEKERGRGQEGRKEEEEEE